MTTLLWSIPGLVLLYGWLKGNAFAALLGTGIFAYAGLILMTPPGQDAPLFTIALFAAAAWVPFAIRRTMR